MKNFIGFMILMCAFLLGGVHTSTAQESSTYDYDMKYDGTWLVTGLSSRDSISTADSTWYYTIRSFSNFKRIGTYRLVFDRIGGTAKAVTVTLKYKTWLNQAWTTASTITWTGTSDTSINVTSSVVLADYWRVNVLGTTDDVRVVIDSLYFKLINDD